MYTNLVFYLNCTCNLNCTYCYIDKSPVLKKIDKIIEESFNNDYYFNFSKEFLSTREHDVQTLEFWGGEPSIGLHRFYSLLPKFIKEYPNLNHFIMSTNFTAPQWFDEFYGFLNILSQFPERNFNFSLQLSIDGPEYINDAGRGAGVTKNFLEHFNKFIETAPLSVPNNIAINAYFKQTYTIDTIRKLQTKEAILDYFQFFDDLYYQFQQANLPSNINLLCTVPNTAVPAPHTVQDGKDFANYAKLTKEIEAERPFKVIQNITSFSKRGGCCYSQDYSKASNFCGSGESVVGFLPNKKISSCHSGFVDIVGEYKEACEKNKDWEERTILNDLFTNSSNCISGCWSLNEYREYEQVIKSCRLQDSTCQRLQLITQIRFLAKCKQIDEKYEDEKNAIKAANYIMTATSYCVRDNAGVTGSLIQVPDGLLKLLLNGAREYLDDE